MQSSESEKKVSIPKRKGFHIHALSLFTSAVPGVLSLVCHYCVAYSMIGRLGPLKQT